MTHDPVEAPPVEDDQGEDDSGLPPFRMFKIRRVALPDEYVICHRLEMTQNSVLLCVQFRVSSTKVVYQVPRAFATWLDYEEIPMPPQSTQTS